MRSPLPLCALAGALAVALVASGPARAQTPRFSAPAGCHDYDFLFPSAKTARFARALPLTAICPFEPRTDCLGEAQTGRSRVALKNHPTKAAKDKVSWRLKKGVETRPADLGDPTTTTDYELCVYLAFDDICWLILHPDAPAGEGWKARRNGFRFKAKKGVHPEGLRKIRLRWGLDRKVRLQVSGTGDLLGLDLPPLPEDAEILVQLYNSDGQCWSTEFGDAPKKNDARRFLDRSDAP